MSAGIDIVVPTIGRASLRVLLASLAWSVDPDDVTLTIVDDRRTDAGPLWVTPAELGRLQPRTRLLRSGGRGPASARNLGWRAGSAPWVAFLDDDVVVPVGWFQALRTDLAAVGDEVAAVQGRIDVPLPPRATDHARNVSGLMAARWATADMAYRRAALESVHGFDERFPRAYREDADLALRVLDAGWELRRGDRCVTHPAQPASPWISIRQQAGNADDALMRSLHGRSWRLRAEAPAGRLPLHAMTVASAALAAGGALARRRGVSGAGVAVWSALTASFFVRRVRSGPRSAEHVLAMLGTSVAIPFAAVAHRLRGWYRWRGAAPWPVAGELPAAVLFDRDGTLIEDVPDNADPERVRPLPGAREALARLRAARIPTAVVTNQAAVGRGAVAPSAMQRIHERVDELVGPIDAWIVCTHTEADACDCRKPAPGGIARAARMLGVRADACVMIGDTEADLEAACAAGARGILVPNARTLPAEVARATARATTVAEAVEMLLGPPR